MRGGRNPAERHEGDGEVSDENGRTTISRDTRTTVGSAAAVVVAIISAALWLNGRFADLDARLVQITYRLDRGDERMEDRWTGTHQRIWAAEMRRLNPTLVVPEVSEILR